MSLSSRSLLHLPWVLLANITKSQSSQQQPETGTNLHECSGGWFTWQGILFPFAFLLKGNLIDTIFCLINWEITEHTSLETIIKSRSDLVYCSSNWYAPQLCWHVLFNKENPRLPGCSLWHLLFYFSLTLSSLVTMENARTIFIFCYPNREIKRKLENCISRIVWIEG